MKAAFTIMLVMLVFCSGCGLLDGYNASGLNDYFVKAIGSTPVKYSIQKCVMSPSGTRSCYLIMEIEPAEFAKLEVALNLKKTAFIDPVTGELDSSLAMIVLGRLEKVDEFKVQNTAFDLKNFDTWKVEPLKPGADLYLAKPALPPISGNSRTSFDFLIYDSGINKACVFLGYPYG